MTEARVQVECYRQLLLGEIEKRSKKNRKYSMRAFARDIDVSPGYLSLVLAGRKGLSEERAFRIAEKLKWSQRQTHWLINLVRLDGAKTEARKESIRKQLPRNRVQAFRDIPAEVFDVMANWYHSAILTLTEVEDFKYDPQWIAKRLNIPIGTVSASIKTLKNLGLVKEDQGTLKSQFDMLRIGSVPSKAIREHHRQFLKKAEESLERQAPEIRDISGTTVGIRPEHLPAAKALIKQFREELAALLDDGKSKTQVYRLSIQLFRIDTD